MGVEKPILFSGPMVRAILEGRKTQTRRALKSQPQADIDPDVLRQCVPMRRGKYEYMGCDRREVSVKPYAFPGDKLWVHETWRPAVEGATAPPFFYRADDHEDSGVRWHPSIHMPRWASRITLEVVSVRIERVQGISEEDIEAEGLHPRITDDTESSFYEIESVVCDSPFEAFQLLWDSINGKRLGYSWEDNPWVWAISFKMADEVCSFK